MAFISLFYVELFDEVNLWKYLVPVGLKKTMLSRFLTNLHIIFSFLSKLTSLSESWMPSPFLNSQNSEV